MDGVQVAAEDQVRTCPQAAVFQYSPIAIQPQGVDHSPGGQLGGGALRACADAHSLQVMDIKRAGANGGHPVGGAGKDSGNGPQVFISGGAVLRAVDSGIGGVARHQPQVDLAGGKVLNVHEGACGGADVELQLVGAQDLGDGSAHGGHSATGVCGADGEHDQAVRIQR